MPEKIFREIVQSIQVVHRKCNSFRNAKIVIWAKTEKGKEVWVHSLWGLDELLIEAKVKIAQELFENLVGSEIDFVRVDGCCFIVKGSLPKQFAIKYKELKEKKKRTAKKEVAWHRREKKSQIPTPTIAPQESRCGSMPGFLNVGQNILDQEPFHEILLFALKKGLYWKDYWKQGVITEIKERFKPRDRRCNSWEAARRYDTRMTVQCFLVNAATKRITYEGIMSFQVSPLKEGLPKEIMRGMPCEGDLFEALMGSAVGHPEWDVYLQEYRRYVTACGEPRSLKRKIPTFASWSANRKSEVSVG